MNSNPGDDLLTDVVRAHESGELSDDELVAMFYVLIVAGFETSVNLVANGVLALHPTQDDGVVVAELSSDATALATGSTFQQRSVSIVTVRDGRITLFRDYWYPWAVIEALGGPEAFARAAESVSR